MQARRAQKPQPNDQPAAAEVRRAQLHRHLQEDAYTVNAVVKAPMQSSSVLVRLAERFGVDPEKMLGTLKATAFKGDVSNEQMMALAVVADQYGLNPWTKEIYAFPDRNGIVPV